MNRHTESNRVGSERSPRAVSRCVLCSLACLAASGAGRWSAAEVINLDARSSAAASLSLDAGSYEITPLTIATGGTYDAWNPWSSTSCSDPNGCPLTSPTTVVGWLNRYTVFSDALASVWVDGQELTPSAQEPLTAGPSGFYIGPDSRYYQAADGLAYPTAQGAAAHSHSSRFTLSSPSTLQIQIVDSFYRDNSGGLSFLVTSVPGPSTGLACATGALSLLRRRRRPRRDG